MIRAFVALGVALLLAGAVLVPLPLVIVTPGAVVPVADDATVEFTPDFAGRTAPLPPLDGTYLRVDELAGPSLLAAAAAAIRTDQTLRRPVRQSDVAQHQPVNMAALIGLGLSPARMQDAPMPVEVSVADGLDSSSLAVALQVVDTTLGRNAADGRVIAATGAVTADGSVVCTSDPAPHVRAADAAGADLVIVPVSCDSAIHNPVAEVVAVTNLGEAVQALVGSGPG